MANRMPNKTIRAASRTADSWRQFGVAGDERGNRFVSHCLELPTGGLVWALEPPGQTPPPLPLTSCTSSSLEALLASRRCVFHRC